MLPRSKLPAELAACLFRVDPYFTITTPTNEDLQKLTRQALKEMLEDKGGENVTFGTEVILKHFLSGKVVKLRSDLIGGVIESWPLCLSNDIDSASVLHIQQTSKASSEDTPVDTCSSVALRFTLHASASRLTRYKDQVVAGREFTRWQLHPFRSTLHSNEQMTLGIPFCLKLKTMNFFLGCKSNVVQYADLFNTGVLWTLVTEDYITGGDVKSQGKYYLRNLETGSFIGPPNDSEWKLVTNISDAILVTILSLSEEDDIIDYEDFVKISVADGGMLGVSEDTLHRACLATINPSAYKSHDIKYTDVTVDTKDKLDSIGVFQVVRFEDSPTQLLLYSSYAIACQKHLDSLPTFFSDFLSSTETDGEFLSALTQTSLLCSALKDSYHDSGAKDRAIFITLQIPKILAGLFVVFNDMKEKVVNEEEEIIRKVESAYEDVSQVLIQMMETDLQAREQVRSTANDMINYVNSEPKYVATIFKMAHDRLEKGVNPVDWINSMKAWMPSSAELTCENATFQDLVLSIVSGSILTLGQTNVNIEEIVEALQVMPDAQIFRFKFRAKDGIAYASLINSTTKTSFEKVTGMMFTEGDDVFVGIHDIWESQGWPNSMAGFVAMLINFYTSCYTVIGKDRFAELFPDLGLTLEVLFLISSHSHCRFRIRTASFNLLSEMLYISKNTSKVRIYDEQEILSYASRFQSTPKDINLFTSNYGQLVLKYLAVKELPKELAGGVALEHVLPFVASLLSFAGTIIESGTESEAFQDAIQRCVLWALSGSFDLDLKDYTGNWLSSLIAKGIRGGPHMIQKVNQVVSELFSLLLSTTRSINDSMTKLTLAKFSNIRNRGNSAIANMQPQTVFKELEQVLGIVLEKRSTADRKEMQHVPPLNLLRETLFQALTAALKRQFAVTEEVGDLLMGLFAPVQTTLYALNTVVYSKFPVNFITKFREDIKRKTFEADVISKVDVSQSPETIIPALQSEYQEILNQITAIERSPIRHYAKIIIWQEKIKYYLLLWDRIYGQINKGGNSEEANIQLYRLASAIFAMYRLLLEDNPKRLKEFLAVFKPFLFYMDLADEAWLIKEFSNYQNITPKQMATLVDILVSRFYDRSVLKSGAFLWIEAMVVNSDGSLKKDLQSAAYLAVSKILDRPDVGPEETGSFAMCLKMMSLCAFRNLAVQSFLITRVSLDSLLEYLDSGERTDVAEAVLLVLARAHANKNGLATEPGSQTTVAEILEKVLAIAQKVFKTDNFQSVLRNGYYDQVKSRININIHGHYYSQEEYETVSLLRLISSGATPEPYGGITGCVGVILNSFYTSKDAPQESDKFRKIAVDYKAFLIDFKGFILDTEKLLRKDCDFTVLLAAIDKALKWLMHLLKVSESAKNEKDGAVLEGNTSAAPTDTSLPKDDDALLNRELAVFVKIISQYKSWKEVYITNISASIRRVIARRIPSPATFLGVIEDIVFFFQGREKHMFYVITQVLGAFKAEHLTACNRKMMKLLVNRLLSSKNFEEVTAAVECYEAYGDLKDPKRYLELMEVLTTRNTGSKLLAKIKRALTVETRLREVIADSSSKKPKSLTAALRKAKVRRFIAYNAFGRVIQQHNDAVKSYIGLLESWCDNSNSMMQKWVAQQGTPIDINIVTEVLNFSTSLLDLGLRKKSFDQNKRLILSSLDCLCEFVSGPCELNQRTVGESVKLFMIIGEIMKLPYDKTFTKENPDEFIDIRASAFWMLAALLEGNPEEDLMDIYYRFFNEIPVVDYVITTYNNLIQPNARALELDLGISPIHSKIVNFSMSAMATLVRFCSLAEISVMNILSTVESKNAFMNFFSKYIGYVEIYQPKGPEDEPNKLECIHGIWFVIPFMCKFLTSQSATDLIVNVNHNSQQDKLADFMNLVEPLEAEMVHQRRLRRSRGLKAFTMLWNRYQDLASILVISITLYILFMFGEPRNTDYTLEADIIMIQVLGVVQALLYLLGYIAYVIEQYPRIVNRYKTFLPSIEMREFTGKDHHESISSKYVDLLKALPPAPHNTLKCINLLTDYMTVKTTIYFIASVIALAFPLFFPFLLLELAESKPEVRNVFRSVTQNWGQLVVTAILGVILVYIFSVFSYVYFSDFYDPGNGMNSDTLYDCFMSTLNNGIRNGAGIAGAVAPPGFQGSDSANDTGYNYWGLLVFDICFFVIVIVLMLNLIFGIIISTFGELRSERNDLYADINNKCYICGIDRSQVELYGEGWQYHFQIEHSPFAYLAFLVHVRTLENSREEMTGIQNYVLKKFKSTDSTFLPTSSRLIAEKTGEKKS